MDIEEKRRKRAEYMREYWKRNPEKARELHRKYREKHGAELNAKVRADRKSRPEYYRAIDAKKYAKNHDRIIERMHEYNSRGAVRRRKRYQQALKFYGLSPEQFDRLVIDSCGRCTICLRQFIDHDRDPSIDHCHKEGHIRGLLCYSCNNGLGRFRDSPELLRAAALYLES